MVLWDLRGSDVANSPNSSEHQTKYFRRITGCCRPTSKRFNQTLNTFLDSHRLYSPNGAWMGKQVGRRSDGQRQSRSGCPDQAKAVGGGSRTPNANAVAAIVART